METTADVAATRVLTIEDFETPAQRFFAAMAAEAKKPHFGDQQRSCYTSILIRAQEAGLYTP